MPRQTGQTSCYYSSGSPRWQTAVHNGGPRMFWPPRYRLAGSLSLSWAEVLKAQSEALSQDHRDHLDSPLYTSPSSGADALQKMYPPSERESQYSHLRPSPSGGGREDWQTSEGSFKITMPPIANYSSNSLHSDDSATFPAIRHEDFDESQVMPSFGNLSAKAPVVLKPLPGVNIRRGSEEDESQVYHAHPEFDAVDSSQMVPSFLCRSSSRGSYASPEHDSVLSDRDSQWSRGTSNSHGLGAYRNETLGHMKQQHQYMGSPTYCPRSSTASQANGQGGGSGRASPLGSTCSLKEELAEYERAGTSVSMSQRYMQSPTVHHHSGFPSPSYVSATHHDGKHYSLNFGDHHPLENRYIARRRSADARLVDGSDTASVGSQRRNSCQISIGYGSDEEILEVEEGEEEDEVGERTPFGSYRNNQAGGRFSCPSPTASHISIASAASTAVECRAFTAEQLAAATDNYSVPNFLGKGAYGTVFRGALSGCQVAVKRLEGGGWQGPDEYHMEVEVLSRMRHPHIVLLMGHCPEDMSLVYEYLPGGSLQDYLKVGAKPSSSGHSGRVRKPLPWWARIRVASEVASALNYLHHNDPPIAHRDLKPENILLDKNTMSKVGDVGLARLLEDDETTTMRVRGTAGYIDPEEVTTCEVSVLSDVYALGLIMLQMLMGEASVKTVHQMFARQMVGGVRNTEKAVELVMGKLDSSGGEWPRPLAQDFATLALRCANKTRSERPDVKEEVHPALNAIREAAEVEVATQQQEADTQFLCPISKLRMKNPVVAADGFTYEKSNIEQWLESHEESPCTKEKFPHKFLTPNNALRALLATHV